MKKYISKLHYLTQDLPGRAHPGQARIACEAGATWIQYRCFSKTDAELLQDIHEIAAICDDWGATLIVTDHYRLIHQADIQGVHMENMQADLIAIRNQIGVDKTLGASANSFEDIKRQWATGAVDYFGCGPFSMTTTKPNDYPVLGTEGYSTLMARLAIARIDVPVLAVGGVKAKDVPDLIRTGIHGIAVSAAVNLSEEPGIAYKELHRLVF